ncbi:MAG: hypothetical protein H7256_12645 [Bdellovibrio sp.]|nr:hypothetical protein [Bdellovibrio sp.]
MKNYDIPWTIGSVFICNKCGAAFDKPNNAEDLKKDLRVYLKEHDAHKQVRVMVSGCLNICDKNEQAVMYQLTNGPTEIFTVDKKYDAALNDLKTILDKKINS